MPSKPEQVAAPAVIKWTEEEWQLIAGHLLEIKGRELLNSSQLDEVKAKDVFLAQDVLPKGRHRKLISISQGFQSIRQRLHGNLQKLASSSLQEDMFGNPAQSTTKAAAPAAEIPLKQQMRESVRNAGEVAAIDSAPAKFAALETPDTMVPPDLTSLLPRLEEPPRDESPAQSSRQAQQDADLKELRPNPLSDRVDHGSRRRQPVQAGSPEATGDFIELARPFVSMVCQEFANALVSRLTEGGSSQAISSLLQSAFTNAGLPSPRNQQRSRGQAAPPSYGTPKAQYEQTATAEPLQPSVQRSDDEDVDHDETDVQPLFDPKLPPSANSAFKPMVALIGTSVRDFEDLQRYFPQLELKVVPLDDLRTASSLRSCQRIIGLREDIPAPADEFLRKTFRNRYLRIIGGMSQLREQLNALLSTPGTTSDQPRWPRKQGSPNGKASGAGFPKKRQFRRPKDIS